MHPAFYRGPAMVKPPIVFIAGLLRARRRGVRQRSGRGSPSSPGSGSSGPPNVAGWDDDRWLDTSTFRGRWIAANEIAGYDAIDDEGSYDATEGPKAAVRKAAAASGASRSGQRRTTRKELERYAGAVDASATADWQQEHLPAAAPERAAHADRHLPRDADLLRSDAMGCKHCEEFTPLPPRAPRGRRGRARAARRSSPGCRPRRAPGSAGARSCCARAPRCSPSTGPRSCGSATSRTGSRRRPGATTAVLVSIFLDGGVDSLSVLAPTTDPIYRSLRPSLALPPGRRHRVRRGPAPALEPGRRRPSTTCTARAR